MQSHLSERLPEETKILLTRREFLKNLVVKALVFMVGGFIASKLKNSQYSGSFPLENLNETQQETQRVIDTKNNEVAPEILADTANWVREATFYHQGGNVSTGIVTLAQTENGEKCIVSVGHLLTEELVSISIANQSDSPGNQYSTTSVFREQMQIEYSPLPNDESAGKYYDSFVTATITDQQLLESLFGSEGENNQNDLTYLPTIGRAHINDYLLNSTWKAASPDIKSGHWWALDIEPLNAQWDWIPTDNPDEHIAVVPNMLTFRSRAIGYSNGEVDTDHFCKGHSGSPGIVFLNLPGEPTPRPYLWGVGASLHADQEDTDPYVICGNHLSFATPYLRR
jgi:hypothetical protein